MSYWNYLASKKRLEQQDKNNRQDLVIKLINNRNLAQSRSHEKSLDRDHQKDMVSLKLDAEELTNLRKEESTKENTLRDLGVVITEHGNLNEDDKTTDGNNLLSLTYNKEKNLLNKVKEKVSESTSKVNTIKDRIDSRKNRIAQLDARIKDFDNIDRALSGFSSTLFQGEAAQPGGGDFMIDDAELGTFIKSNENDFNKLVEKFGGGEKGKQEVVMRLRGKFSDYTKNRMDVLNKVMIYQNHKLNQVKVQQDLGMIPGNINPKMAKKSITNFDDDVKKVNSYISDLGKSLNFSKKEIEDDKVLQFLSSGSLSQGSGIVGLESYVGDGGTLDVKMSGFVKEMLDVDIDNIPSKYQNDHLLLAKWFGGQIADYEIKEGYEGTFDYEDKEGNKYKNVPDLQNQITLSQKRIAELDLRNWSATQPENVQNAAFSFFRLYSEAKDLIKPIHQKQNDIQDLYGINLNTINYSSGTNQNTTSDTSLSNSEETQKQLDASKSLREFSEKFNMEPSAILENASKNGLTVEEYIDTIKIENNKQELSDKEAKELYNKNAAKNSKRAIEIIDILDNLDGKKEGAHSRYLNQFGDIERQKIAKERMVATGSMGAEWENLHQSGVSLVRELKSIVDKKVQWQDPK